MALAAAAVALVTSCPEFSCPPLLDVSHTVYHLHFLSSVLVGPVVPLSLKRVVTSPWAGSVCSRLNRRWVASRISYTAENVFVIVLGQQIFLVSGSVVRLPHPVKSIDPTLGFTVIAQYNRSPLFKLCIVDKLITALVLLCTFFCPCRPNSLPERHARHLWHYLEKWELCIF